VSVPPVSRERVAAAVRARHDELLELVALRAEAIASALRRELGLVAWDCQVVIGRAQLGLRRLVEGGSSSAPRYGPAVRIIERARQPLECLPVVWGALLRGCQVWLGVEAGASTAAIEVLRTIDERLRGDGVEALTIAAGDVDAEAAEVASWPLVGVEPALSRLAVVSEDGDRELAAYVLARTCLRRSGDEPRTIHHALVCGPTHRLERYLQRLWVGVVIGPAEDPESFTGPVGAGLADAYLRALERWRDQPGVRVLLQGGRLERADDDGIFLAPALFRLPWPLPEGCPLPGDPELPVVGPMLLLYTAEARAIEEVSRALGFSASRQLWIAPPPRGGVVSYGPRYVQGALIVERMPPGLPEPRPA